MVIPVIRWIAPQLDDAARVRALAILSPAELARYEVTAPARRGTFLAGRLVLRELLGELMNLEPAAVDLVAVCPDCGGPHGAPTVRESGWRVSLSHSAAAVVAAAAWQTPVGVDLEGAVPSDEVLGAIGLVAGEASLLRWTRVEAILKADGRGLRVDPTRVHIDGDIGRVGDSEARYALSEVELAPGLTASLAVRI